MKKLIKYLSAASVLIAQNLFAQTTSGAEGMDMGSYATWMGSIFFVAIFIMFAIFLFSASKEPLHPERELILAPIRIIKNQISTISGNLAYLLPNVSLELKKIRFVVISALIIFSFTLLLSII